jgi:hypothetical protein
MYVAGSRWSELKIFSKEGRLIRVVRSDDAAEPVTDGQRERRFSARPWVGEG